MSRAQCGDPDAQLTPCSATAPIQGRGKIAPIYLGGRWSICIDTCMHLLIRIVLDTNQHGRDRSLAPPRLSRMQARLVSMQHLKIVSAPLTILNSVSFHGLECCYASLARPLGPPRCLFVRGLLLVAFLHNSLYTVSHIFSHAANKQHRECSGSRSGAGRSQRKCSPSSATLG